MSIITTAAVVILALVIVAMFVVFEAVMIRELVGTARSGAVLAE